MASPKPSAIFTTAIRAKKVSNGRFLGEATNGGRRWQWEWENDQPKVYFAALEKQAAPLGNGFTRFDICQRVILAEPVVAVVVIVWVPARIFCKPFAAMSEKMEYPG